MRNVRTLAASCALLLAFAAPVAAQQTIFVVRHAERADTAAPGAATMTAPANDPPLSAAGHERAARLAAMLRSADIKHIFTTEFARTKQTAAPSAKALSLESAAIASKDLNALVARITEARGNVLVVGHSNTVPEILKRLGVKEAIVLTDTEFDHLFVVVRGPGGDAPLVRLRY